MTLDFVRLPIFDDTVAHAFTTRQGGESEGPYASLNITRSRGDEGGRVTTNRDRVRSALGLDYLVFATQVHGKTVIRVDGAPKGEQPVGEADALITDRAGIGLVCQTADCTPILLHDPVRGAVGAIHSGWRGTVQNIVAETVAAMTDAFGSSPADLRAGIGPSVSAPNYRVGPEVVAAFEGLVGNEAPVLSARDAEGGAQLDVGEACLQQLLAAGLAPAHIARSPLCTYAEEDRFFSARRSHHRGETGLFGGQGGVIGLRS